MIIVVDAGSTKSHIRFIEGLSFEEDIVISGINPFYQSKEDIVALLKNIQVDMTSVSHVFHFGAGCSFPEKKEVVKSAWKQVCINSEVLVDTDMLGAAIALFGDEKGIACILGTGANSCLYENGKIISNVPPLGFILGDEGSGAYLGKLFVADCMKGILPRQLVDAFYCKYQITPQQIMDGIYKSSLPSKFLASFVPFISSHIDDNLQLQSLVQSSFRSFFKRNVLLYDADSNCKIGFIGGVAKQFEPFLKNISSEFGFNDCSIMGDPMDGMAAYYRKHFFH